MSARVVLRYPFRGRWQARNSPATRVPSHGTHLLGTTYAIDFVAVDERGRSGPRSWRTVLSTEPPERFAGFGSPVLAPVEGTVVLAHDGEVDGPARRSPFATVPYAFGQRARLRGGAPAIAGNHVVIALSAAERYVLLAHLRRGTVRPGPGDRMVAGEQVGECGSSGNSTEPHVHVQVTDSVDWSTTQGIPLTFRDATGGVGVPTDGQVVVV